MSYHVLARRWRPQTFSEMVGQEHVLKALTNALSHDRLHHAYLFTGTRGVGKTTVARIFAKSLNCEEGVGPTPCGVCSSCVEIAEGRFVDLIEVDAASRTKVEDTRDLLENVQYAPSRGRFKVYIIDEVHMLSTSSFNALLKTLEEPPEHVKFLLATTDPQKLPVTVLSRCLQFNLKNMSPERIVNHLQYVLGEEKVPFEEPALWLLAKAADGSMRDALSLTDQSIAFGNESVMEGDVRNMLGTVDRAYVLHVLEALANQNAASILDEVARAADHAPDFAGILDELIAVLHRIAVAQMVPGSVDNSQGDQEFVLGMSQQIQPHDVHLFYQIGLASRKDMAAAADQRAALEMTLLRMLAFQIKKPGQPVSVPSTPLPNAQPVNQVESISASAAQTDVSAQTDRSVTSEDAGLPEQRTGSEVEEPAKKQQVHSEPPVAEASGSLDSANESVEEHVVQPAAESLQTEPFQAETIQTEPSQGQVVNPQDIPPWEDIPENVQAGSPALEDARYVSEVETEFSEQASGETVLTEAESTSIDPAAEATTASSALASIQTQLDNPAAVDHSVAGNTLLGLEPSETSETPSQDVVASPSAVHSEAPREILSDDSEWLAIESQLNVDRFTANLAANMVPVARESDHWHFMLKTDMETFLKPERTSTLAAALSQALGHEVAISIEPGELPAESPAEYRIRKKAERLQLAISTFHEDPNVMNWKNKFGAQVLDDTIVPIDNP
ncbi:DNA polymerase III subunit gamma/tau [Litoribacillus peritrichatus]|uniref:DNA polymerase III subunit gamma/tau n=1 Tax=Litoribacillus peritrichatus TaxID=718191 RepID=A0ABP7N5S3_9GAMM